MTHPTSNAGFSLLEVIVAFAIAAGSMAVILQAYAHSAKNIRIGSDYVDGVTVAESILAEAVVNESLESGIESNKFSWRVNRTPYLHNAAEPRPDTPMEATVTVAWGETAKRRQVSITTVYLPRTPVR